MVRFKVLSPRFDIMAKAKFSYDKSYAELQKILEDIESGEVGIDALQEKVKKARELIKLCQDKLRTTEKEIAKLDS